LKPFDGRFETFGDLFAYIEAFVYGKRSSFKPVTKRLPLRQLENKEPPTIVFFEPMNGGDIGVIQGS
jgi:hypothetical protein